MSPLTTPATSWPADRPLVLHGVHARRGGVEILRGIDLTFAPGSRTTIIGPSGSGKSTLLRLLNRLDDPSAGRISLGDLPLDGFPVTTVRRRIGLVFQAPRPLPGTISEGLAYPDLVLGRPAPDDLRESLTEVGLDPDWLDRDASGLSGGERQRLAIAMALRTRPSILVLDEPTSALDPAASARVADLLHRRSGRDGLTVIAVTHSREHCRALGDMTVVLDAGRVVDEGPTAEVLARADRLAWSAPRDGVSA